MSGYSSVFSLGLLATQRPTHYDPMDTDDGDFDTTPKASRAYTTTFTNPFASTDTLPDVNESQDFFTAPRSRTSSTTSTESSAAAPRLRRRRSSLTVGSSTLATIKSPLRNAGAALQRTLMGTGRARSGSITAAPAEHVDDVLGAVPVTVKGRMRSGSLGTALRSRRGLARKPAAAPPTAPLPPLPPLPAQVPPSLARRPLFHRAHNSDNSNTYLARDFAPKLAAALSTPPVSAHPSPIDEARINWPASAKEN